MEMEKNTTCVWPEHSYFKQQPCDFHLDKENYPENSILYINQGYLIGQGTTQYLDGFLIYMNQLVITLLEETRTSNFLIMVFVKKIQKFFTLTIRE